MTDGKRPEAGILQDLGNGIARVLAPNPSPMTFWGTNSYLLGDRTVAVIDPGPASPAHLQALLAAIGGRTVTHILVTHSHVDHFGGVLGVVNPAEVAAGNGTTYAYDPVRGRIYVKAMVANVAQYFQTTVGILFAP